MNHSEQCSRFKKKIYPCVSRLRVPYLREIQENSFVHSLREFSHNNLKIKSYPLRITQIKGQPFILIGIYLNEKFNKKATFKNGPYDKHKFNKIFTMKSLSPSFDRRILLKTELWIDT